MIGFLPESPKVVPEKLVEIYRDRILQLAARYSDGGISPHLKDHIYREAVPL